MKALLMKDFHVLWRLMKPIFLMIVIFAAIPSDFQNVFGITYVAMIPYSSLSADENCKWDRLAAMMPYSARDMVVSKYILGIIVILGTAVFTAAIRLVTMLLGWGTINAEMIVTAVGISVICVDIILPLAFRFGVEKGRLVFVIAVVALVCGSAGVLSLLGGLNQAASIFKWISVIFPAAAVIATAVSIPVSLRIFEKREK